MSEIHNQLIRMEDEFAKVLPAQIRSEKFLRCLMTSIQLNPALLRCDPKSLKGAAMQAAQDGLLPDGRYGVILPFSTNVAPKGAPPKYVDVAQWLPMILGVYQKLHNSGEIKSINAHLVYEKDVFHIIQGYEDEIVHRPNVFEDRGKVIGVYAVAKTTNGGVYHEAMSFAQVEEIRAKSKAPNSPAYRDHWGEMAKKIVVKRLAKRLPLSSDDLDWLYREDEVQEPPSTSRESLALQVDQTLAELPADEPSAADLGAAMSAIDHAADTPNDG
jgi:recombination protein RecT